MLKISIVIPVYNAEKFVERCVDSVLKQTYQNYEIILVDDGSKDCSWSICKELQQKDTRISVFSKENGGPSSARKFGVDKATGEYVFFIDSDDTIPDNALKILIEKNKDNKLDIIQGARRFVPASNNIGHVSKFFTEEVVNSQTYIRYLFQGYANAGPVATLYKLSLFGTESFNLPNDVRVGEDLYMNICLGVKANAIGLYNDIVYNYIENPASSTHTYLFNTLKPQKHLLESIRRELVEAKMFEKFSILFYSKAINNIASACFHNRKLIYEEYCSQIVKETAKVSLSKRNRALRCMLKYPYLYYLYYTANKLRQLMN